MDEKIVKSGKPNEIEEFHRLVKQLEKRGMVNKSTTLEQALMVPLGFEASSVYRKKNLRGAPSDELSDTAQQTRD